ncbi:kinetochore-associated protein 1 isoform X3 [Cryptotermes secundus]|uniref:kinetochore-associated protein 1 isoform X3 n=1 Tax=Cryptotermes secundus TaxID=105785 RepID=UPI000CD7CCC6|nr:kinetochore-associated protein 1 isoform X3 [Cryptotermes secundus]
MAVWADVNTGFDAEEETVNFGTRTVSDDSNGLFETLTLATIHPQGEVVKNPHVIAASFLGGSVCVAIDGFLIVFTDETCSQIHFTYAFDSPIDCFTVSDDGLFIIVGVEGVIHFLCHSVKGHLLFSRSALPPVNNHDFVFIKIFIHATVNNLCDILMIGNSGQILRIAGLNFESLLQAIQKGDDELLTEMIDVIQVETIRKQCCKGQVLSATRVTDGESTRLVLVGDEIIVSSTEPSVNESWMLEEPISRLKTIKAIEHASLLVGLTEDGKLLGMCSQTLLSLALWDEIPVQDFVLLEGASAEKETDILFLTQPNEYGKCYIHLASLPGLHTKFQFPVSSVTFLVPLMSATQELLFLEGAGSPNAEFIDSLHVRNIVESHPEDRFHRLLRRNKFDDAEAFALRYKLNVELVYKEHVKHYMELLQPWHLPHDSAEEVVNFNKFICLLNKIEDLEFVCEACIKALPVNLTRMQTLLDYASDRLKKTDIRNLNITKISYLESQVWSTSVRLDTFMLLYQSKPEDVEWCEFSRADLLNVCKQHVQRGQLSQASLIWARHFNSFKSELSEACVIALLNAIPAGVKVCNLISWLKHFIPSVLHVTPQSVQHVVIWAIKSIKSLEVKRATWPTSGLDFGEKLLQTIKLQAGFHLNFCQQQQSVIDTHCKELTEMISALRYLKQLKENHKIDVALVDFMQSEKSEVVNILLEKVAPDDIKPLVINFLSKFMLDNGLVSDTVLSECMHGILSRSAGWWYYYAEAPWEDTVAAIIPCIHNLEVRIKCIISVLKMAPVPWSSTVECIARQGLEVDHPMIGLVRHEQKMMEVKIVQKKYGFTKLSVENCSLFGLIHHIQLIFKKGSDSMVQDALKFANISTKLLEETYIICIQHYLEAGKQKQALEVLDSLKAELIIKCCQRIVFRAHSYLQNCLHQDVCTSYMEALGSLGSRLSKAACIVGDKFLDDIPLQEVRYMHLLHLEFGKRVSLKDYSHVQACSKILKECIHNILSTTDDPFDIYCKVRKLTLLLQLPVEEGLLEMAHKAIELENFSLLCSFMRNMQHFDFLLKSACRKLFIMVLHCLQTSFTASQNGAAVQLVYSIASNACAKCSLDALPSWLELLHWVHCTQYLTASYEEGSDVFKVLKSKAQDILIRWNFTPIYKDPAIISNSNQVILFLKELFFMLSHVPGQLDNSHITLQLRELTRQLQEQQHDLRAVRLWCSINSWALSVSDDLQSSPLLLETKHVASESIHILLCKVVIARHLDIELGLALLFALGTDAAVKWLCRSLETFRQDFQKSSAVAHLGVLFCSHCKLDSKLFLSVHMKCTWAKRFAEHGMNCIEILTSTASQHMHILQSLMKLKNVEVSLVVEYCKDFELDLQECLLLYLKNILVTWDPEFEIEKTVDGKEMLIVLNTETEISRKCQDIIDLIENKESLVKCLNLILNSLNYYNYEMYIYIIKLLEQLCPSHNLIGKKILLMFLREYVRVQGPKQEELDKWLLHFPQSLTLPKISQWRLPFLPFMRPKPLLVLTPELNLKTYKQWIELSAVLGIEKNNICSVTVRETMRIRTTSTDKWSICSHDSLLLNQIEECVNNISNLEIASACMYFVMNHIPPGADQVAAAKLCYTYTQKWAQNSGVISAKEYLNRVKFRYLCLATTHILHQYDLGTFSYLQLVPKPLELISALYQDPSIVARGKGQIAHFPDINGAVKDLASLHEENYIKLCLNQLIKWLQPKGLQPSLLEDTCDLTRLLQNHIEVDHSDEDSFHRMFL